MEEGVGDGGDEHDIDGDWQEDDDSESDTFSVVDEGDSGISCFKKHSSDLNFFSSKIDSMEKSENFLLLTAMLMLPGQVLDPY